MTSSRLGRVPVEEVATTEERLVFTLSIEGCARCLGDGHDDLEFRKLTHPVTAGGYRFTHWATCPENGEPILLTMTAPDSA